MDSFNVVNMEGGSSMNFPQLYLPPEDVPSSSSNPPLPPPSSAEIPATVLHAPSSSAAAEPPATEAARFPDHLMYKNRLQEFAQKSNIALPSYQTVNEGATHASRFRSTVWVGGKSFTTKVTFTQRKAAEQEVARLALEILPEIIKDEIIKDEECPLVCENKEFSKSILNEYAAKMKVEKPTYSTVKLEGVLPLFVSSLVFNGTKYTGDAARSKKEAERLAARSAILSILDDSSSGTLFGVIKSKSSIYAEAKPNNSQNVDASNASTIANTVTMVPIVPLQPGSEQHVDGSSSKKRRKNKSKANKKARQESPLPVAASPVNEIPCVNEIPPVNETPPVNKICPVNEIPPVNEICPVNEIPSCSVAQIPPCSVAQ